MLVLTREPGQAVQVGENIQLYVLSVKGSQVRLGFEAPKHINIVRTELLTRAQVATTK